MDFLIMMISLFVGIAIGVVLKTCFERTDGILLINTLDPEKDIYDLRLEVLNELDKKGKVRLVVRKVDHPPPK
jgi:hypothetical protein